MLLLFAYFHSSEIAGVFVCPHRVVFFVMPCWNLSTLIFLSAGVVPARCFAVIKPSTSLPTSLLVLLSAYLCSYVSCVLWHPILLIRRFLLSCSLIFTATLSLLFYAGYSYSSLFLSAVFKISFAILS